jgi:hypothetical protein
MNCKADTPTPRRGRMLRTNPAGTGLRSLRAERLNCAPLPDPIIPVLVALADV